MAEHHFATAYPSSPDSQRRLEAEAARRGISVPELVQRAIEQYISSVGPVPVTSAAPVPPASVSAAEPVTQEHLRELHELSATLQTSMAAAVEQVLDRGQESGSASLREIIAECDRALETIRRDAAALETFDAAGAAPVSYERLFRKILNFDLVDEMVADPVRRRHLKRAYRRLYWFSLQRLRTQVDAAARHRLEAARLCSADADIQGQFVDGLSSKYHLFRLRVAGWLHSAGLWRPASRMALGAVMQLAPALEEGHGHRNAG